jgi:hypothetical protein
MSKSKKVGKMISIISKVGQQISKFNLLSADIKLNLTLIITPIIKISSLYVKINNMEIGKMISKISKVGQLISKFNSASEITLLVQHICLYVTKQKVVQTILVISIVGEI